MATRTLDERVTDLEKFAKTLEPLPVAMLEMGSRMAGVEGRLANVESRLGTVESQIVQLRADLDSTKTDILEVIESGSLATQGMFDELQRTVKDGDEETRRQMRVLHEDLVERIERLGEGRSRRQISRKPDSRK